MNVENEPTKRNIIFPIAAFVGWGAFIGAIVYGVYVYGPQRFQEGVDHGTNPDIASNTLLPNGEAAEDTIPQTQAVIGIVEEVGESSITLNTASPSPDEDRVNLEFSFDNDTRVVKRTVTQLEETNEDGTMLQSGAVNETTAALSEIETGQELEITYETKSEDELIAQDIYLYDSDSVTDAE